MQTTRKYSSAICLFYTRTWNIEMPNSTKYYIFCLLIQNNSLSYLFFENIAADRPLTVMTTAATQFGKGNYLKSIANIFCMSFKCYDYAI